MPFLIRELKLSRHCKKRMQQRGIPKEIPFLIKEYGESIKSNFADFANSGAREGGASIAAQFLSRFVGKTPWAHLDIAGIAWKSNQNKGATGRPVPLLMDFLLNL